MNGTSNLRHYSFREEKPVKIFRSDSSSSTFNNPIFSSKNAIRWPKCAFENSNTSLALETQFPTLMKQRLHLFNVVLKFLLLTVFLFPEHSQAQNENNIWYFGNGAGMDF